MARRWVILGAGAVGGVIGAGLHRAGREVVLIARGEHLRRIASQGLLFESPDESVRLEIPVAGSVAEAGLGEGDLLLLAVKSQDTLEALASVRRTGAEPVVVCAQNGLANEVVATRFFDRVYAAMIWVPSTYLEPGHVQVHASPISGWIEVGRFPSGVDPLAEVIACDLRDASFGARARDDLAARKRSKLLLNLANVVHALTPRSEASVRLVRAARREAEAVLDAAGLPYAPLAELVEASRVGMSEVRPIAGAKREGGSTWQSLARGAPSLETDYLNGEIARIAVAHGLTAPINRHLQRAAWRAAAAGAAPKSCTVLELLPGGGELPP